MHVHVASKYGKKLTIIHPGEFFVTDEDELIGTLLGSCVALCLYDPVRGMAGMNHFMLPGRIVTKDVFSDDSAKYGISAIHRLMEAMENRGSHKEDMQAKIFGGGHVLEMQECTTIPADNIRLARIMMEFEDIHIAASDVGGRYTRKVLLNVRSGNAFLKRSMREDICLEVQKKEEEFARRSFAYGQDKSSYSG